MATIRQYFELDFSYTICINGIAEYKHYDKLYDLDMRLLLDFNSNCQFISFFIPPINDHENFLKKLIISLASPEIKSTKSIQSIKLPEARYFPDKVRISHMEEFEIEAIFPGSTPIKYTDLPYTRRVFLYSDNDCIESELTTLIEHAKKFSLDIQIRTRDFAVQRSQKEKPLAFISHDSRDKDLIARPLAMRLSNSGCPVWYDEYSLKIGNSLRESIEKGIKECHKCILVITPNFIRNNRWPKTEFNSIFNRQLLFDKKIILPIWHEVSPEEVFDYCPSLADIFAVNWSEGEEKVSRMIRNEIFSSEVFA